MKDSSHPYLYAAILGIVCATLLTGAGHLTAPYVRANAQAQQVRSILTVLRVPFDPRGDAQELLAVYRDKAREETRAGRTVYLYGEGASPAAIAFPFEGPGVWGPIRGFLALDADGKTIRGIIFYEQSETPGLGGEIASEWFQKQFVGKSIRDAEGKPGIIVKRGAKGPNAVDAITGATMTSEKVERLLNTAIADAPTESIQDAR
ncbi:MAG: FMN-binding protein [Planctomycetota bacterium]